MEQKHTPGEWHQAHRPIPNDPDGMYSTQVFTIDGQTIADLAWYPMPAREEIIEGKTMSVIGSYREANAKLISAAPNLLKALDGLMADIGGGKKHCVHEYDCTCAWDKAKNAIEKATI
jgi:hypothetical protein